MILGGKVGGKVFGWWLCKSAIRQSASERTGMRQYCGMSSIVAPECIALSLFPPLSLFPLSPLTLSAYLLLFRQPKPPLIWASSSINCSHFSV